MAAFLRKKRITASILYITAYQDCLRDAFYTHALDFWVKPVDEQKLAAALEWDCRKNYRPERPLLHIGDGTIPLEEIFCLKATQHKVAFHLADRLLFFPETLSGLELELPPHTFCRSHFSFLVNLSHVREIKRTSLILDNGKKFPVSRHAYPALVSEHITYIKKAAEYKSTLSRQRKSVLFHFFIKSAVLTEKPPSGSSITNSPVYFLAMA